MDTEREHLGEVEIRKLGDPVLRGTARPVTRVNQRVRALMQEMVSAMRRAGGVGLAAPQIGVARRVIVLEVDDDLVMLANPEVVESQGTEVAWEGCLSVPGYLGLVERPVEVTISGLDHSGRKVWHQFTDLGARAALHEIDHLDGVLYPDRAQELVELPAASRLRLVFMGSPEFARLHLEYLLANSCNVVGVVTQPAKPRGRGQKVLPTPVAQLALERQIEVVAPARVAEAGQQLAEWRPDVIVTCAYGQILPPEVLELPALGCINVHASMLPAYRGAGPIQRAIMDGRPLSGVTIMQLDEGLDTGPILAAQEVGIGPDDDAGALHDALAAAGGPLLLEVLNQLAEGVAEPVAQQGPASWAAAITPEDLDIDWSREPELIHNQVRALSPAPGARTRFGRELVKVLATRPLAPADRDAASGTVTGCDGDALVVAAGPAGRGRIGIVRLAPAGRPIMTGRDFFNGYCAVGSTLGGAGAGED